MVSFVDVTNITIQWDPVPCQDHNQPFDNFMYRVTYYPSSDQRLSARRGGLVDQDSGVFPATRLPPRTSYIFEVQAFNLLTVVGGLVADLMVNTSNPQSKLY